MAKTLTIGDIEKLKVATKDLEAAAEAAEEYLEKATGPQNYGALSALRVQVIRSLRDARCKLNALRQQILFLE
jgi:hypothetical protein